jgi:hypothetical protein
MVEMKPNVDEVKESCCPGCGEEFVREEVRRPVCLRCAARLDRELAAYLEFVALSREGA